MNIEFRAFPSHGDTYGIEILVNGKWVGNVLFIDLPAKRVCKVDQREMGWSGSKMQAEEGARQAQELYNSGAIK